MKTCERCVDTIALATQRSNSNSTTQHMIVILPLTEHITNISKRVLHQNPHLESTVSTRFVCKKCRKRVSYVGLVEENGRFCVLSKKLIFFHVHVQEAHTQAKLLLFLVLFLKCMMVRAQVKAETRTS